MILNNYLQNYVDNTDWIGTEGVGYQKNEECMNCENITHEYSFFTITNDSGGLGASLCKKCTPMFLKYCAVRNKKIESYGEKNGLKQIQNWLRINSKFKHKQTRKIIPALKHEALVRANYKCQDCGISKNESPLEVDHIISVSQGGSDELCNLQVLCFDCNRAKHGRCWEAGN